MCLYDITAVNFLNTIMRIFKLKSNSIAFYPYIFEKLVLFISTKGTANKCDQKGNPN